MTVTCRLCGLIIHGQAVGSDIPLVGDPDRAPWEYQAVAMMHYEHVRVYHPEHFNTLAATANTYHIHLVNKLATSTDPEFTNEQESQRRLIYWTLAGRMELDGPAPKSPHLTI